MAPKETKISRFFLTHVVLMLLSLSLGTYLLRHSMFASSLQPSKPLSQPKKYPKDIPKKFDPNGNVQHYPGNTIICHLSPSSEMYASMQVLHDKLKEHRLSHSYTLLPPSSWHMTVFEGAIDTPRKAAHWPADLDLNASIADCTAFLRKKLESFDLQYETPFRLTATDFKPLVSSISIHVEPRTKEEKRAMSRLRDRLARVMQMRRKSHKKYRFHLTVAYFLRYLSDEEKEELGEFLLKQFRDMPEELELGAPEFCRFENMFAFERLLYLKNREP